MGSARVSPEVVRRRNNFCFYWPGCCDDNAAAVGPLIGGIASGGVFKQPHLMKDAQNVGEERVAISESTVEKVTDAMYGVVNESGGTGTQLKLAGVELSGKSGTAQVIGYNTKNRLGKQKKFEDNAWFVGYAPKRNPEIVVAVLVQESGQHGGEAAGPVARDIVKAYYDKKNRKTLGTVTATDHSTTPSSGAAVVAPVVAIKPQGVPATQTHTADSDPDPQ